MDYYLNGVMFTNSLSHRMTSKIFSFNSHLFLQPAFALHSYLKIPFHVSRIKCIFFFQAQQKPGVQVQNSIVYYDALPGLETVRSTITINSTQELFKSGRMKLSCVATMYSLYKEIRDMEIMEDTPQIAPIREHSTHNLEAVNSSCTNPIPDYFVRFSQFLIFLTHLWMRRLGD